ncbi:Rtf2 RING-finger-domain-containing protein [Ephemerocybe angulata]|uniref:Rtf2 RING-finger-domain-containing protein n=1 Tax=Ephemerocybe angulata TaxID=980116 RepID=A0A8H6M7L3_9AGAR|nr:Rtf2 RING-finger-domain-containing protein [Tulosesus angulatus]
MGNDGGSIPDRRDLVKTKAKAEQADKANQTKARWFYCALSKKPLQEPVVSCPLGKLYNKDAIIEYLLDKTAYGDGEEICGHIRSLKDVKPLKLTPNGAANSDDTETARFACPLTLKEMNGVQPFVYIFTCGCVFSQAGLRTVSGGTPKEKEKEKQPETGESSSSGSTPPAEAPLDLCPQCGAKYSRATDVIVLNPSAEEEQTLRWAMEKRRASEPSKKKSSKKRKQHSAEDGADGEPPSKKERKGATPTINASMGTASRAVMQGLAEEEAKRKATMSEAVKSLYGDGKPARKETFMTMGTFTRYA